MSAHLARSFARIGEATVLALALTACAASSSANAPLPANVRFEGTGAGGERIALTFVRRGAAVATNYGDGVESQLWLSEYSGYRRGISGDVYPLSRPAVAILEGERVLLTRSFEALTPANVVRIQHGSITWYRPPGALELLVQRDARGRVQAGNVALDTFAALSYDGTTVVHWESRGTWLGRRFDRSGTLSEVDALPKQPRPIWERRAESLRGQAVDASVGGVPARVVVDTGTAGLAISAAFAGKIGAIRLPQLIANDPGDWGDHKSPVVALRDVTVGGVRVGAVGAVVVPDSTYDLVAGIGLFPNVGLSFDRSGRATMTTRQCRNGIPFAPDSGLVLLSGPDEKRPLQTRLATGYRGHPAAPYAALPRMDAGLVHMPDHPSLRCEKRARSLTFGGRRFGSDVMCTEPVTAFVHEQWNLTVGLDSMSEPNLLVDNAKHEVCWWK
jgi:Aspartyl protease